MPASIGSNQASPANSAVPSACVFVLVSSMAWSPPALERRKWLVEQTRDYATNLFPPPSLRHRAPSSTQTNTASTRACPPGATSTRRSAMDAVSMPATRTATAFARSTSTRWRGSGCCCVPGFARIEAFRRTSCRFISASSSSCTTRADAAKSCSERSSPAWWRDGHVTTPELNKSHRRNLRRPAAKAHGRPMPRGLNRGKSSRTYPGFMSGS